jgi:hypothetical protein
VPATTGLRLSDRFDDGIELLAAAERMGLEGVVSKRRDAAYRSGPRCGWIKTKTKAWREANKERWRERLSRSRATRPKAVLAYLSRYTHRVANIEHAVIRQPSGASAEAARATPRPQMATTQELSSATLQALPRLAA